MKLIRLLGNIVLLAVVCVLCAVVMLLAYGRAMVGPWQGAGLATDDATWAWIDGQPAGGGALEIHDGVAALMAADTLPAYRKRGLHTLLLHARLAAATAAGCDLALVHTAPGSASQNNVLRAGFQLAYTALTLVSPA